MGKGVPKGGKGRRRVVDPPHLRDRINHQPKHRQWAMDMDYLHKLGPEEVAFMAQFVDEYWGCDFRYEEPHYVTTAEKRERYDAKNRMERDLSTHKAMVGLLFSASATKTEVAYHPLSPGSPEQGRTPEYLREAEYQSTLAEYRALVDIKEPTPKQLEKKQLLFDFLLSIAESRTQDAPAYEPEEEYE